MISDSSQFDSIQEAASAECLERRSMPSAYLFLKYSILFFMLSHLTI